MSKRGPSANFGGDEARYGGSHNSIAMADSDKPTMATAAQMARRKIANTKTSSRRSASPAVTTVPAGNAGNQFQIPTQSGFNFSFGNTNTSFSQQPQQNGSPAPYQFGQANQTQQNSTITFGQSNTNSFGTTSFNSTSTQPQQNGFTPSATPIFGQAAQHQQQPQQQTPSSFQFGQTQSNGLTPTPSTGSIFKSFGEQNQTPAKNDVTFKFGASQPDNQATKPANAFANFGQKQQENGDKPVFGSTTPQPPATPGTSNIFGGFNQATQQNGDKPLFGASVSKESFTPSAPATTSVFSNMSSKPLSNGDKPLFSSQLAQETPKPASNNNIFSSFASQPETNGDKPNSVQQTPSSSLFNGFGQNKPDNTEPHKDFSFTTKQQVNSGTVQPSAPQLKAPSSSVLNTNQPTPKPTANIFSSLGNQSQVTTTPQDTSMTTPDRTPRKPTDTPATSQKMPSGAPNAPSTTDKSRSLFDRIGKADADKAQRTLSGPLFTNPQATPSESAPKPFFTPSTKPMFSLSAAGESSHEPTPQPPKTAPAKSLFDRAQQPLQSEPHRPSANVFNAARTTEVSKPAEVHSNPPSSVAPSSVPAEPPKNLTDKQLRQIKHLNTGLLKHLQSASLTRDWSAVFRYYFVQTSNIYWPEKSTASKENNAATTSSVAKSSVSTSTMAPASAASGPSHPPSSTQTPQPSTSSSNTFSNPPQTAPVQKKKRLFEDDDDETAQPPATDKRTKTSEPMNYPKLPDTASNTAKIFEATLDKPKGLDTTPSISGSGFKPSTQSLSSTSKAQSGFKPALGFTPTVSSSGSGGSMFAAFGQAAKAQEEKDRSKRKAEDYDSDDETAEEWEKRDREEQESKRAKIAEAAKSGAQFVFGGTSAGKSSAKDDASVETPKAQPKSLFERITPASPPKTAPSKPSLFSTQTPSEPRVSTTQAPATAVHSSTSNVFGKLQSNSNQTNSNIFGFLSDKGNKSQLGEVVEKEQGTGDKTFNPGTPIKFGSSTASSTTPAAAPASTTKPNGLFGSLAPVAGQSNGDTPSAKPAPASLGFNIGLKSGVLAASRATTPGVTTDGEGSTATGADEAEGEEQNEPQAEDKTALQPDELESNEVLFELGEGKKALCKKYEENKSDVKEWVGKGKGPLYILKSKQTGKVRLLLKIAPFGKLAMNYEPLKGIDYKVLPGAGKTVSGAFFDHLHVKEPKIGQFTIQVKEADDAKEIARILNEAASK